MVIETELDPMRQINRFAVVPGTSDIEGEAQAVFAPHRNLGDPAIDTQILAFQFRRQPLGQNQPGTERDPDDAGKKEQRRQTDAWLPPAQ